MNVFSKQQSHLSITYNCTCAYSVKPGKTWFNNLWIIHSLQLNKPDTKIKTGSMGHDRNCGIKKKERMIFQIAQEHSLYLNVPKVSLAMPKIEYLNELSVAHLMHIPVNHNNILKHLMIKMKMLPKRSKTIHKYCLSTFLINYQLHYIGAMWPKEFWIYYKSKLNSG